MSRTQSNVFGSFFIQFHLSGGIKNELKSKRKFEIASVPTSERTTGQLPIQQLFEQFPTTSELLDATEQQLTEIKGIGMCKARQVTAILKLAKALTATRIKSGHPLTDRQ
ncbi:hypothetical protein [Paenibacillus sp. B01]|uniref:hypothetical protein n=1 Tax=Paenibacillus sp. B01 TaxID=2660554 RepID=UPI00129A5B25|nr:hypothetical protein [Paenibacillus sp. B01]QGG55635.1 hypothetical protein GE073_08695 [Paenibacillus sp. B01]